MPITEKYYTSLEHLSNIFDKGSRKLGLKAKSGLEFREWTEELRKKLHEITGIDTMDRCSLLPQLLESTSMDGYRRDKMLIQTETDVWMPFYVLIPNDLAQGTKMPCVIATHGHESAGKFSVSGREDIPEVKAQIAKYNYDYGVKFVREGYIVFCPDARAFGERREWTKQGDDAELFLASSCEQLNHMAICLGQSLTGMWIWDLMRLADYIESRTDCGNIGSAGLSGGGLQTLWFAALDDRVKCAVVSGYFYGYKDSLLKKSDNCSCNYVPSLWEYIDMGDLGALVAPRPLLIESGIRDPLNGERGVSNVIEQVEITQQAYRLIGVGEKLFHYMFDGEHIWDGTCSYKFMDQYMK